MDTVLLMFRMKLSRIPSAGVGGLCVGIFSSFARLALCRGFVCLANVLKIAWVVGSAKSCELEFE